MLDLRERGGHHAGGGSARKNALESVWPDKIPRPKLTPYTTIGIQICQRLFTRYLNINNCWDWKALSSLDLSCPSQASKLGFEITQTSHFPLLLSLAEVRAGVWGFLDFSQVLHGTPSLIWGGNYSTIKGLPGLFLSCPLCGVGRSK